MHKDFKKFNGDTVSDIIEYINKYIQDRPKEEIKLYIGTDSQRIRRAKQLVMYAIVICIYTKGKGAHIIYKKIKRDDIKDMFNRLWWEVEYSIQIATYLRDSKTLLNKNFMSIHIDINANKTHKSNQLATSAIGYVTSCGFDYRIKPDAMVASYAADMLVR